MSMIAGHERGMRMRLPKRRGPASDAECGDVGLQPTESRNFTSFTRLLLRFWVNDAIIHVF